MDLCWIKVFLEEIKADLKLLNTNLGPRKSYTFNTQSYKEIYTVCTHTV